MYSVENISGNARFSIISSGATAGVNELNVSMDARTNLTCTTLDANANIIDSYITDHKTWLTSGHTGTANKLFGSDANGLAKEYELYTVSEITLLASGWSANSQTLTVSGIGANDWLTPYPKSKTDQDNWATSELFCSAHTTNSVTFTCVTAPTADIVILIKIEKK